MAELRTRMDTATRFARRVLASDRPLSGPALTGVVAVVSLAIAMAAILPDHALARSGLAVVAAGALCLVSARSLQQGLVATMSWLLLLGLIRRLVTTFQADPSADPLLLVAPTALVVLLAVAVARGAGRPQGALEMAMATFAVVMALWVLHPTLGLRTNLEGLLFWLVPMAWYGVGRVVDQHLAGRVATTFLVWATVAAGYGVLQVVVGFPPWDDAWIDTRGYRSLEVNGPDTLKAFGFSSSAGEHALVCAIGVLMAVLLVARARRRGATRDAAVPAALLLVLVPGLIASGTRTPVVLLGVALLVVAAVASGRGSARTVVFAACAVPLVILGAWLIDTDDWPDQGVTRPVTRIVDGIGHPFDPERSTLGTHLEQGREGVVEAFRDPLGDGTAAGTLALDLGDDPVQDRPREEPSGPVDPTVSDAATTEVDVADAGLAFGLVGLVLASAILVMALVGSVNRARAERSLVTLLTVGVLVLSLRFWWLGSFYAASAFLWLLLGAALVGSLRTAAPEPTVADP